MAESGMNMMEGEAPIGLSDVLSGQDKLLVKKHSHKRIEISKVENGFIIHIGCETFVSKDWEEVNSSLKHYWKNPREAIRQFCK